MILRICEAAHLAAPVVACKPRVRPATPYSLRIARHLRYPARMISLSPDEISHAPREVRLKTLVALRWFAVIGQAIAAVLPAGLLTIAHR